MKQEQCIELAHGAGGKSSRRLIEQVILAECRNPLLEPLADAAIIEWDKTRYALTTDSYVISPLVFPGGSIGELAVNGTVNDLAVSGAKPLVILSSWILEAGLSMEVFQREVKAMARAAKAASVIIAGGDTKVVEHGKGDGLYITTTGYGLVEPGVNLGPHRVEVGDKILLSGPIGDHGITVLLARGEIELEATLQTDSRPLWPIIEPMIRLEPAAIKWMRDPTRGGLASVLNELAHDIGFGIMIEEESIPIRQEVRGACEILGLDPLHIASEGQFVAVVDQKKAVDFQKLLNDIPGGEEARIIGVISNKPPGKVVALSGYGGSRMVDMLIGDPLPRIC
ncbi:hydrogenase expression/formation protein HypE [Candidatus Methylacidiphilum fumarolicum]|uniref:(NiFe) hydrogenase metallocenter assembly protein HypE n=2 Tax=Candidatus Methylacidiphilum fumarolicum TaxID=591154 RepID=I0K0A6_METFB|nr:hydrogenase expression/formation protein HypE [Candidatus Methylacidiphilum fumarolicum]MBW6414511.1 hydrogenase expression/formation protein HypE [Candidatus Methylacidiphilum fumarolicum]TFE65613.1 hydrogenase expression/formation protein HypE [Candidatus Methylacidiphilum fumarolicum]TFE73714.1 hydrogenase expression/formation protein HypE [Candidatus Methylacidiphilum fumarolicum]TFE75355.1 hydrogenase expression/formation protein HypE [Candidatus Methylacidiphilum fumarolicum]TFE77473.